MSHKPTPHEEEYFAREEAEKKRKLIAEKLAAQTAEEREAQKKLHYMKCPKCGADLTPVAYKDIEIDRCFGCGGVYLDTGELEHLAGQDQSYLATVFRFFIK